MSNFHIQGLKRAAAWERDAWREVSN